MNGCVMRLGNDGLDCTDRACYRCGWNPVIEEKRKTALRAEKATWAVKWRRKHANRSAVR